MTDEPIVKDADCCAHCSNTGADFTFSDAVMCFKTNDYRMDTDTCQLFEKKVTDE